MKPNESFEAGWTIENIGTAYWNSAAVDIMFVSGTEMHTQDSLFDLPQDVPPTGDLTFSIKMEAPGNPGTYESNTVC